MDRLNPQQRAAVVHRGSPLLVLAGAGSGKTRVITRKIAHLVGECGVEPSRITAVTFTNKAAREMRERVGRMPRLDGDGGLRVCTFHTLGLEILRREHKAAGLRRSFSIVDAEDSAGLLKELAPRHGEGVDQGARWRISLWKNQMVTPEAVLAAAQEDVERVEAALYADYQRQLRAYNAVDFDDLIALPVSLLEGDGELREAWRYRIRHLLVDEYQDTSESQYQLTRLLVGDGSGLTAVGDDDQSIYGWRGARPENIGLLREQFPDLRVIKLEQNYRSSGRILATANGLIARNPHVVEKRLWSATGPGDRVRVVPCATPDHEAHKVVSTVLKRSFRGARHGDFAVLYRGNHQSRPFEKALREHNIPYRVSGGPSFFDRSEVKDVVAYLRLVANADDDVAFLRVVNTPRREIGPGTLERLAAHAVRRGVSLLKASGELGLHEQLGARPRKMLERFSAWVAGTASQSRHEAPAGLARRIVDDVGYRAWLSESSGDPRRAARRERNVDELLEWIERMGAGESGGDTLEDVVARLALADMLERDAGEQGPDAVHLMTLHAAKGLEFDHVFMVGMEEGLLPHQSSIDEGSLDEERRLAYVGITRARKTLSLSFARARKRFGELVQCEQSRFLAELPDEHVEWEERVGAADTEETRETGRAHLSHLKAMLGT